MPRHTESFRLTLLPDRFAICRLSPDGPIPAPRALGDVWSLTRTHDELSVLVASDRVPEGCEQVDDGWRCFRVAGPLDLDLVGIVASLAGALASADVSSWALSTYDTDYLCVRQARVDDARAAFEGVGHVVERA